MLTACNATDQRLDEIIQQNNRMIAQLDELIALGKTAIATIEDALGADSNGSTTRGFEPPPASTHIVNVVDQSPVSIACDLREPARKRKKS